MTSRMTSTFNCTVLEHDLHTGLRKGTKIPSKSTEKGYPQVRLKSICTCTRREYDLHVVFKKGTKKRSKNLQMTSIFNCHFQAGMAGYAQLACIINKISFFHIFPASTLLYMCGQTSDYILTDTTGMAHSLSLYFITSKNSTL